MRDTFGPTSPRQFAEYDPDSSCWRTYPATGLWGSTSYTQTWPRCGTTLDGRAYELPTWVPPTPGSGSSSLLPTPVSDHSRGLPQPGTDYASLPNAVIDLLPTPRQAGDRTSRSAATRRDSMNAPSLGQAVEIAQGQLPREFTTWEDLPPSWQLLPTPTAADSKASGGSTPSDVTLTDAVIRTQLGTQPNMRLLPTPTASPYGSNQSPTPGAAIRPSLETLAPSLGASTNPPSDDGNECWAVPLTHPPSSEPEAGSGSPLGLWNG